MITWPPTDDELYETPTSELAASFHFTEELRRLRTWFDSRYEMMEWIVESVPSDEYIRNDLWTGTIGKDGMLGRYVEKLHDEGVMYYPRPDGDK